MAKLLAALGGIATAVLISIITYLLIESPTALLAPKPTATPVPPTPVMVAVPDVVGLDFFDANMALIQVGLLPRPLSEPGTTVPPCQTIRTDPAAGTRAAQRTVVTLYISPEPSSPQGIRRCPDFPSH